MNIRDNLPLGLSLGHLDSHHFLESIASPLGMYFRLLSRAWRSPHKPENKRAPHLQTLYSAGLISSWSMDGTLADLFGVDQRTIPRWRDWLTQRQLIATVGETGKPLAYVLGSWEQRSAETHWAIAYYWDPVARGNIHQILAGLTYDKNVIGSSPTYVKVVMGTHDKVVMGPGVTHDTSVIQEEEYRKTDSIKDNISVIWAAAVNELSLTTPSATMAGIISLIQPVNQNGTTITLQGPTNAIAWGKQKLNGHILEALRIATKDTVTEIEWQEARPEASQP